MESKFFCKLIINIHFEENIWFGMKFWKENNNNNWTILNSDHVRFKRKNKMNLLIQKTNGFWNHRWSFWFLFVDFRWDDVRCLDTSRYILNRNFDDFSVEKYLLKKQNLETPEKRDSIVNVLLPFCPLLLRNLKK